MAFTYTEDLTNNINFVRFHTGDVIDGENFLSDGIITSLVTLSGSKQGAVIAGLKHIILRLSQPNFRADWLQVDNEAARRGYEKMLDDKMNEFGISAISAEAINTYRP